MKTLPERLAAAASFVDKGAVVADVGCDHGLLPHYLLKHETASFAYLIDKNRGPLLRAEENTEKYGLNDRCAHILSDGLKELPDYIKGRKNLLFPDTVMITGMGGPLMLKIIEEAPEVVKENTVRWILSPQSLIDEFLQGLDTAGFDIIEEKSVSEKNKHYRIFLAEIRKA